MTFLSRVLVRDLPHLQNLTLADPTFDRPGKVDLLIGRNALLHIVKPDMKKGIAEDPVAMKTVFGWAILGNYMPDSSSPPSQSAPVHHLTATENTDSLLCRFWETEEVSLQTTAHTVEEREVINHFNDTHVYSAAGRYKVTLPRWTDVPPLSESCKQALMRYEANERSVLWRGNSAAFQEVVQETWTSAMPSQCLCRPQPLPPRSTIYPCTSSSKQAAPL